MSEAPELRVYWSKRERDVVYHYADRDAKALGRLLSFALEQAEVYNGNSFRKELVARGYDLSSLKISIRRLK